MPLALASPTRAAFALALVAASLPGQAHAEGPTRDQCIDANEEAQDLRREGSLTAARARLSVCVATECPRPVREDCVQRLTEIDAATPTLVVDPADASGPARVTLDGRVLDASATTAPLPIDPGAHHLVFERDGQPPSAVTVVVHEGEKEHRVAPAWLSPVAPSGHDLHRTLGLVLGGVGVAGLAVGGILAIVAKSTDASALRDECGGNAGTCSAAGAADGRSAHAEARASTFAFLGGGALLATGAVVFFTAPGERRMSLGTAAEAGGAGLRLNGEF